MQGWKGNGPSIEERKFAFFAAFIRQYHSSPLVFRADSDTTDDFDQYRRRVQEGVSKLRGLEIREELAVEILARLVDEYAHPGHCTLLSIILASFLKRNVFFFMVLRPGMSSQIRGVPTIKPRTARDLKLPCFAGALEATLSVTRHPASFTDILGVSGLAFRTRWRVTKDGPTGCPCSPVGECESVWKAIERGLGWGEESYWGDVGGWDNPDMQRAVPRIIGSIESGMPVLVIDKHLDSAVVFGYDGEGFLVHTYYESSARCSTSDLGQTPAGVMLVKRQMDPPPFPEVLRGVLEDAVKAWYKERVDDDPPPFKGQRSGRTALEAWIEFLTDFDTIADTEEPSRHPSRLLANHLWAYQHLHIARRAAANFLQRNADAMESGRKHLVKAGTKYQQEASLLETMVNLDKEIYDSPFPGLCQAYFDGAWDLMSGESWDGGIRGRVKDIMQESLELEKSAIQLIESALDVD